MLGGQGCEGSQRIVHGGDTQGEAGYCHQGEDAENNDQKGKDGSKLNCTSVHFESNVLLVLCLNIKIKIT